MATVPTGADKVPIDMLMHRGEEDDEKGSVYDKPAVTFTADEEKALLKRLDWRLLPMMMGTWALAYYGRQPLSATVGRIMIDRCLPFFLVLLRRQFRTCIAHVNRQGFVVCLGRVLRLD
jgi:hypothetical protein